MTLRVAFPFVGDSIGGSHVSAALLMRALVARNISPVAVVHREGPLTEWLRQRGIETLQAKLPYFAAGGAMAAISIAAAAPSLARYLRQHDFQLVHANDGRMIATWMPAARYAGHVGIAHRRTKWSNSRLAHVSLRLASKIIAISDYVRDSLPDGLRRRACVIHNPFADTAPARAEVRRKVVDLSGKDGTLIAFVGTLQAQKRPAVFLRAAASIRRNWPDARFLMIGQPGQLDGEMRHLCAELGLADVTVFLGFRAEASELLAGCNLLLAPAIDEGHGRALVEAMIAGTPVIAARSGGHIEILQHGRTGLLVAPDDADEMAQAALSLLAAPDRANSMSVAAQAWARGEFSPAAHAEAVAKVYREFLG